MNKKKRKSFAVFILLFFKKIWIGSQQLNYRQQKTTAREDGRLRQDSLGTVEHFFIFYVFMLFMFLQKADGHWGFRAFEVFFIFFVSLLSR